MPFHTKIATSISPTTTSPTLNQDQTQYTIRTAIPTDIPHLESIERSAGEIFRTVGLESVADDEPMPPEVLRMYLDGGRLWVATSMMKCKEEEREGKGERESERAREREGEGEKREQREGQREGDGGMEIVMRGERNGEGGAEEIVGFLAAFPIDITGTMSPSQPSAAAGRLEQPKGEDDGKGEEAKDSGRESNETESVLLHIAELSVHASHQRRGLGARLLRHFEEYARTQNTLSTSSTVTSMLTSMSISRSSPALAPSTPTPTPLPHPPTKTTMSPISKPHQNQNQNPFPHQQVKALSLTTYAHLPFNLPFYERHGFSTVPPDSIEASFGVRARELWDEEQGKIAMPGERVWGVKWLV